MVGFLTKGQDWGADYVGYITQAKIIFEGSPETYFETNRFILDNSPEKSGPLAYPWGYPLLLAPVYKLFGLDFLALKSVAVITYLLFLGVFWIVFRQEHSPLWFLSLLGLFALNPKFLDFPNSILSDFPFLFVSTICMWLIQNYVIKDKRIFGHLLDSIILGITISIAYLIRTNGILLLGTLVLSQIIAGFENYLVNQQSTQLGNSGSQSERKEKPNLKEILVKTSPYLTFFISTLILELILPKGGAYHTSYLQNISIESITRNLSYSFEVVSEFFSAVPLPQLMFGASVPLAIAGAFKRYRLDYPYILYIIMTFCLYMIWPFHTDLRFLFPLFPFYFSFVISGLELFVNKSTKLENSIRKVIVFLPVFIIILSFLNRDLKTFVNRIHTRNEITYGPFTPVSQEMFSFVEGNTEPESVIIFMKPRLMHFLTDRKSIRVINDEDLHLGDYLIIYTRDEFLTKYQIPEPDVTRFLEQESLSMVYENQDFIVYRINMD
jgi:hypothetical protein